MSKIIEVSTLSKSYIISHEGRDKYTALRDVMAQKAKKIFSFPSSLRGRTTKQSPYKEEFWALKDVSFDIEQGDRVGIIGRNGAGKSTLLKILSRITEPTTGTIKIKGRVASLLEVGTGFHPELTGRENIFLNGAILGMSRVEIKKHFDAIVDFAEVEKFLDTPVKRYSSGMYVRLAFAVAAHLEPEILVVDEVLAVGDAEFQKKCLGKMEDVSKNEGRTVLFVSHNMGMIMNLCEKCIFLSQGQVSQIGMTGEVINTYTSIPNQVEKNLIDSKKSNGFNVTNISLTQNGIQTHMLLNNVKTNICISFESLNQVEERLSFEMVIKNKFSQKIIFISLSLGAGVDFLIQGGKYVLSFNFNLPFLAQDNYSIDLIIVEPFVKRLRYYQDALKFEIINGFIEKSGWTFKDTEESIFITPEEIAIDNA